MMINYSHGNAILQNVLSFSLSRSIPDCIGFIPILNRGERIVMCIAYGRWCPIGETSDPYRVKVGLNVDFSSLSFVLV